MRNLVIVNQSSHPEAKDAIPLIRTAINKQLHDFARGWGEYVWKLIDQINDRGFQIVLLDDPDVANALGYHDVDPNGKPYARIFINPILSHGGSWISGELSVSVTTSHEVCELLGDPGANRWANDYQGNFYALEASDCTEADSYSIHIGGNDNVSVSNFVYPEYFNPLGSGRLDHLELIQKPFEIRPGGYAIKATAGNINYVFGENYEDWKRDLKGQEGSRAHARGGTNV